MLQVLKVGPYIIGHSESSIDGFVKNPTSALRCIPCPVKFL